MIKTFSISAFVFMGLGLFLALGHTLG